MKITKLMLLFLLTITSPAAFATTLTTHLNSIAPITCKHGDIIEVTAQLWSENYFDGFWDNAMIHQDLYFHLFTEFKKNLVLQKKEETKWMKGKATVKIDTKNIEPGKYLLLVAFKGDSGLLVDFSPCTARSSVTMTP